MAKSSKNYVCQSCGAVSSKWAGKCESCAAWNSLIEEIAEGTVPKGLGSSKKGHRLKLSGLKGEETEKKPRHVTQLPEFDRVTGGGLVPGSIRIRNKLSYTNHFSRCAPLPPGNMHTGIRRGKTFFLILK